VRFGKVWDDARSIFLILLLLFVELSLTFDEVVVSRPETGAALLLTGLLFSVLVSEGLLAGLRIRLPALYRVPYHLFLGLLFLYPLVIVAFRRVSPQHAVWSIFWFSSAAGAVLLTLLPAVRRGVRYIRDSGTPWKWPWFPWSLFVFLTICVALRAYALSLSFDPVLSQTLEQAMRLEGTFGIWFLIPLVLASAVLLLEAALVSQNALLARVALAVPAVCVLIAFPAAVRSAPYADFLDQFTKRFGSPVWLTTYAAAAYYLYAWMRRVRFAEESLLAALALAAIVGPRTLDMSGLVPLQSGPLCALAGIAGTLGFMRRDSRISLAAAIAAAAAFRAAFLTDLPWLYRDAVTLHLVGAAILGLGLWRHDPFSRYLRKLGVPLLATATISAAFCPEDAITGLPAWAISIYLCSVVAVTIGYAYVAGSPYYFFAGLANAAVASSRLLYDLAVLLRRLLGWEGAGFFVLGLVWFALAVAISATKAGIIRRLSSIVPQRKP
jgi:hypothetical protein